MKGRGDSQTVDLRNLNIDSECPSRAEFDLKKNLARTESVSRREDKAWGGSVPCGIEAPAWLELKVD